MFSVNNTHSSVSCSPSINSNSTSNEHYLRILTEWEKNSSPGEERGIAFNRLSQCFQNQEAVLNLSDLNLTSLPELPNHISALIVENNKLTSLPKLPAFLKELNADNNRLSVIPELPESLTTLSVRSNQLENLPVLPNHLTSLFVENNRLYNLPALPEKLKFLHVYYNRLTTLPDLPDKLEILCAQRNNLVTFPQFSDRNNIRQKEYYFHFNQITTLPESFSQLDSSYRINISGNPLSTRVLQSLQRLTSSPDYHGPQIYFSMSDGQQNTLHRPLADAVTAWFPENKQSDVSQIWHAFEHEEHANTFSAFLDRLSDTVSARNTSGFREQVAAWLEKLSASAELRQQSFAVAADATESCEDRVALTWNNLRKTLLVHQASEGLFDNDTGALLSLGREMFRLEILEDIARDKVRTLHFVDEIEVYLAFQTML
ncbi:T3SS effector E3 ubiquitin-protein ligase IpaH7.8, partial [Shigella boydii]|nr:T3SS effector E3 ubiquitin-protein ligase IpaH7.8 [Shigella boydii]